MIYKFRGEWFRIYLMMVDVGVCCICGHDAFLMYGLYRGDDRVHVICFRCLGGKHG